MTAPLITPADARAGVARELRLLASLGMTALEAERRAVEITRAKIGNSPALVNKQTNTGRSEAIIAAMRAFDPQNEIEAMLASAAIAMHPATMECSRRAMLPNQQPDAASRLRRDAANSARVLVEVTEATERRRGKGSQQLVRVEKVMIGPDGQAVIGNVSPARSTQPPPRLSRPSLSRGNQGETSRQSG